MNIPEDRGRYPNDPRFGHRSARDAGNAERADRTRRLLNIDASSNQRPRIERAQRTRSTFGYALVASVVAVAAVVSFRMFPALWSSLIGGDRPAEQISVQARSPAQPQGGMERQNKQNTGPSNLLRARLVILQAPRGVVDEPMPLGLSLDGLTGDAILVIGGLPSGTRISAGRPLGTSEWRLSASEISKATIRPPEGFVGSMDLVVELQLADGTLADRQSLRMTWAAPAQAATAPVVVRTTPFAPPPPPAAAGRAEENAPQPRAAVNSQGTSGSVRRLDRDEMASLLRRGDEMIAAGDIGPARLLLQRAAEAGDPRAAFLLATTYDPFLLETRGVVGVAPDIKMARSWYEKAQQLGSTEASRRLEFLASRNR